MARVRAPLHSAAARGTMGKVLTFRQTKQGPVVQKKRSKDKAAQPSRIEYSNILRAATAATRWVNRTTQKYPGAAERDEERIRSITPSHKAWNQTLHHAIVGKHGAYWTAAELTLGSFGDYDYEQWDAAASALVPAIRDVRWRSLNPADDPVRANGIVFFHLIFGLYVLGLAAQPGTAPPTYA